MRRFLKTVVSSTLDIRISTNITIHLKNKIVPNVLTQDLLESLSFISVAFETIEKIILE